MVKNHPTVLKFSISDFGPLLFGANLGLNVDLAYLKIYPRPQTPHQRLGSKKEHFQVFAGESKPFGLYSAPCWGNEVSNLTHFFGVERIYLQGNLTYIWYI